MSTKDELQAAFKAKLAQARTIVDTVDTENRDYTATEETTVRGYLNDAKRLKQQWQDADLRGAMSDLGNEINGGTRTKGEPPAWATKHRRSNTWAKATVDTFEKVSHASGVKALVSGSIDVPSPIYADITRIAQTPGRLIDLLINRRAITTNTYNWIKQTVRTNLAAVVADGATKPTSVYTVAEVEDRVRVIAHLSEALPERLFADHADLEAFLVSEMEYGLLLAVEAEVMTGDGTGEHMAGLLNTSGTLVQTWSADLLTTLRKAVTALQVVGEQPTAWAINPVDVEVLDLLTDNEARMYWAGPQTQMSTGPVWSLPIVQTLAVPQGTAVLGDWSQIELIVREDAKLDVDRSGDLFKKNQVQLRLEGRYGVAVRRPGAFVEVATEAP